MNIRELVGYNLRRVRSEKEITQEALSAKAHISQQYISELESGRRNPSVTTVAELARALGVSHIELVKPIENQRPLRSKPK